MVGFSVACLVLAYLAPVNAWIDVEISRTLRIGGENYYLPPEPEVTLDSSPITKELVTVSVLKTDAKTITGSLLQSTIQEWMGYDDVFSNSFLQTVLVINNGSSSATLDSSAAKYLKKQGVEKIFASGNFGSVDYTATRLKKLDIAPGPYVLAKTPAGNHALYKPLKLRYDSTQSFFKGIVPRKNGSFTIVSAAGDTDSSPYIGTPSKVYAADVDPSKYPLSGVRVTVKDIYHLDGLKTSGGNRAFYEIYGPRNKTGPAVSRLMSLGAEIIGMTKTVQFANGDRATADWVDYHAPFTLRGDGYFEPSGSSTGAGTSTSAHDWIDVSIGSDTGGSIRAPAGVNLLYGIRPSVGAISLDEVIPLSAVLDTAGYMTRDPKLFSKFGKAWYAENENLTSYPYLPKKVLRSSSFDSLTNEDAKAVYESFLTKLTDFLGATRQNFSIAEEWNKTSGVDEAAATYFNQTYATLISFYQWNNVGTQLFADYAAANEGRTPHINPAVLKRWRFGQERGQEGYTTELSRRSKFEDWALTNIFPESSESCSETILASPNGAASGSYSSRETYISAASSVPFGLSDSRLPVYGRGPEIAVPIGEVPFVSNITGVMEYLPVSINLASRRNCDFVLLDLIDKLADAGIVVKTKTGRRGFE